MPLPNPFRLPSAFGLDVAPSPPSAPALPPLTPEEEESLFSRVGSSALHGLGWIGSSLDKAFGGRAIRGLLGGRPEELLSAIPFSDTLGITDQANAVSGAELITGRRENDFFSPEGVAGMGLEIALDPSTYLSFGGSALTKLGQSALKANVLPKTVAGRLAGLTGQAADDLARATGKTAAEVTGQRLGGHVGVGLPFMGDQATFDLTGPMQAVANLPGIKQGLGALDTATDPLRRGFSALFEASTKGQTNPVTQDLARHMTDQTPQALYEARGKLAPFAEEIQRLAGWQQGGQMTPQIQQQIDELGKQFAIATERIPTGGNITDPAAQALLAQMPPEIVELAKKYRQLTDAERASLTMKGYLVPHAKPPGEAGPEYLHRQGVQFVKDKSGKTVYMSQLAPEEMARREDAFRGMFTHGDRSLNQLSLDRVIQDPNLPLDKAQREVLERYLGWTPQMDTELQTLTQAQKAAMTAADEARFSELLGKQHTGTLTVGELAELRGLEAKKISNMTPAQAERLKQLEGMTEKAKTLTGWQRSLDIDALDKVGGFFGNHPLADLEQYLIDNATRRLSADAAYQGLAKMAQQQGGRGTQNLETALTMLGLEAPNARANLLQALGGNVPLNQLYITQENLNTLANYLKPSVAPEGAKPWLQIYDSLLNLTKAGQTAWPQTVARNFLSDLFTRFAYGGDVVAPLLSAKSLHEGQVIPGLAQRVARFQGMTDEQATQALLREIYQLGLADTKKFQSMDVAGMNPLLETARRNMPTVGVTPTGLMQRGQDILQGEGRFNPLAIRGVGGRTDSDFIPVALMQSGQNYLEELNRIATYLNASERGFNPMAALGEVTRAHHDFANLSRFEKDVMRRIIPFYGWMRQNLPAVGGEIATNPGGRMAQTMRGLLAATSDQPLPEYASQTGFAIPIGQDDRGRSNYISSLGLPFEDLANLTSLQQLMGSTTPALRMPYELATGRLALTGRDMPAQFPVEGSPTINSLLINSPIGRAFTSYRTAMRGYEGGNVLPTALQLLAGPRVANIDDAAARRAVIRDMAEQQLASLPEARRFQRLSIPTDQLGSLTERELAVYRLYLAAQAQARQAAAQSQANPLLAR